MPSPTEEPPSPGVLSFTKAGTEEPVSLLKALRQRISRLLRRNGHTLEEDMAEILEEHDPEGTRLGTEEREILHNVLTVRDVQVDDAMVPRSDIVAISEAASLVEIKRVLEESGHTRMPVYQDTLDNVLGFVHIKDLVPHLGGKKRFDLKPLVREVLFVSPSMKIIDLLVLMRKKRVHMAVVVDEYGATDGLVTLEDLVEEIVGEIEDEHDEAEAPLCERLPDGSLHVQARMELEDLEKKLGAALAHGDDAEEIDTIGGLIFSLLGRVPEAGETIPHPDGEYTFHIQKADNRRIHSLIIQKTALAAKRAARS